MRAHHAAEIRHGINLARHGWSIPPRYETRFRFTIHGLVLRRRWTRTLVGQAYARTVIRLEGKRIATRSLMRRRKKNLI